MKQLRKVIGLAGIIITYAFSVFGQASILPPFTKSYSALSNNVWNYKPLPNGASWDIDFMMYGNGAPYTDNNIKKSNLHYGKLADSYGDTLAQGMFEWDYKVHVPTDKDAYILYTNPVHTYLNQDEFGDTVVTGPHRGFQTPPVNKADAYQQMRALYRKQCDNLLKYRQNHGPKILYFRSLTGHRLYQHYAYKWRPDLVKFIGSEIGENVKSTNAEISFLRGAARQYGLAWDVMFSWWLNGYSLFEYANNTNPILCATCGHSMSYTRRCFYLAFMSGANALTPEGASNGYFDGMPDASGVMGLSNLGNLGKEVYDFTHLHKTDRGIPYTPIAIMLDSAHGVHQQSVDWEVDPLKFPGGPANTSDLIWYWLPYTGGDNMTRQLFNVIWPYSFNSTIPTPVGSAGDSEQFTYLTNSTIGEFFDVLLEDATPAVMQTYPVLYLSGDVVPDASMITKLQNYVSMGNTLVINSSQITSAMNATFTGVTIGAKANTQITDLKWTSGGTLTTYSKKLDILPLSLSGGNILITDGTGTQIIATSNNYNSGKVIVTSPVFLQDTTIISMLIKKITGELTPVTVTGDIQYLLNKDQSGWVLTLINNKGISKTTKNYQTIDVPQKIAPVRFIYAEPGMKVSNVVELISNTTVNATTLNIFDVSVNPGDVKIYKIMTIPLPITLLDFNAEKQEDNVVLTWHTAEEKSNDYFSIERSINGFDFIAIGQLPGAGNTNTKQSYSFIDAQAPSGKLYYRLGQHDVDGKITNSEIRLVNNPVGMEIFVSPNPFTDQVALQISNAHGPLRIKVLDTQGRLLDSRTEDAGKVIYLGSRLLSGLYIVEIMCDQSVSRVRVVKE